MQKLGMKQYGTVKAYYRPGTSDENVLKEVVEGAIYRRRKANFDVLQGEHWLDLGGNIGAFAIYARSHGATTTSYEPDTDNFAVLQQNVGAGVAVRSAVSSSKAKTLALYTHTKPGDHSRNSLFKRPRYGSPVAVPNTYAGTLRSKKFDGVKLDMEGGEFGILDDELLPKCQKLCMEYHTSIDSSMKNFHRRVAYLRAVFGNVAYPAEFDRNKHLENFKPFFDRMIFAWRS